MKKALKILIILICAMAAAAVISAIVCRFKLSVKQYDAALEGVESPVKAVLISDLHGREYGEENERLINTIAQQNPDVIFLDGDFLSRNSDEENVEDFLKLIPKLAELAPVYYSPGNHEADLIATDFPDLLERIENAGAVVVNDSFVEAGFNGQTLRIGGTLGHMYEFGRTPEEYKSSDEYKFMEEFTDTETPTVCLCHRPDTFIFCKAYANWDVDLVLSGHTHGGVMRIPGIGGVIAPMQGLFPEYDSGYFKLGDHMQLVISPGLSGYNAMPRIFNLPEVSVINIVPEG